MRPQRNKGSGRSDWSVAGLPAGLETVSARTLGVLALHLVLVVGPFGCSGGGTPSTTVPVKPVQPVAAKPAAPPVPPAKPGTPGMPPPYVYEAKARRDPFRPLIQPRVVEAKAKPKTGLAALEVSALKLAGIVWEQRGFFALVEAPDGKGYVLRLNDTIGEDARVAKITPEAITFEVKPATLAPREQPQPRMVEIRLRKEE